MNQQLLSYKNSIRVSVKELEAVTMRLKKSIRMVNKNKKSSGNDLIWLTKHKNWKPLNYNYRNTRKH